MSRVTDAILGQKAFGRGSNQPMVDPTFGGQMGYAPNLPEWNSNQAYVRKNVVAVLLEAPRFFQLMPDSQKWVEVLKSFWELHARTIDGLKGGLTVDTESHPVGGAGEEQDEVTNVKRERSEVETTVVEKYGNPFQTFFYNWITYGIMDPDTKFALANTLEGARPEDMLADQFTCSVLFFEPDPQHKRVVRSWVGVNMMPKSTGEIIGKRDVTAAGEISTLSIPWTGIYQFNLGTSLFAQSILDKMNMTNANPYLRPSVIQGISPDVEAAVKGYRSEVEALGRSAVPGLR